MGDELRLTEDLHLDSLGRVQLSAAIEERLGIVQGNGLLEDVQTLGELRQLVAWQSRKRGARAQESKGSKRRGATGAAAGQQAGRKGAGQQLSVIACRTARPLCLSRVAVVEAVPMAARDFS